MRIGEPGNRKNPHTVLHPREVTIAELLRGRGYETGIIGKWHVAGGGKGTHGRGAGPYPVELMPNAQGFDYFLNTRSQRSDPLRGELEHRAVSK